MITYNDLYITPDGKCLVIDASVSPDNYFDGVVISNILIDTQDTFILASLPSDNHVYSLVDKDTGNITTDDITYCTYSSEGYRRVRLQIDLTDSEYKDLQGQMLFVYVQASGIPSQDTPCCRDKEYTLGTAINMYPFYTNILSYTKQLNNNCQILKNFIDYILKEKAFRLAIKTGCYQEAINLWKYMNGTSSILTNCGCNG